MSQEKMKESDDWNTMLEKMKHAPFQDHEIKIFYWKAIDEGRQDEFVKICTDLFHQVESSCAQEHELDGLKEKVDVLDALLSYIAAIDSEVGKTLQPKFIPWQNQVHRLKLQDFIASLEIKISSSPEKILYDDIQNLEKKLGEKQYRDLLQRVLAAKLTPNTANREKLVSASNLAHAEKMLESRAEEWRNQFNGLALEYLYTFDTRIGTYDYRAKLLLQLKKAGYDVDDIEKSWRQNFRNTYDEILAKLALFALPSKGYSPEAIPNFSVHQLLGQIRHVQAQAAEIEYEVASEDDKELIAFLENKYPPPTGYKGI